MIDRLRELDEKKKNFGADLANGDGRDHVLIIRHQLPLQCLQHPPSQRCEPEEEPYCDTKVLELEEERIDENARQTRGERIEKWIVTPACSWQISLLSVCATPSCMKCLRAKVSTSRMYTLFVLGLLLLAHGFFFKAHSIAQKAYLA